MKKKVLLIGGGLLLAFSLAMGVSPRQAVAKADTYPTHYMARFYADTDLEFPYNSEDLASSNLTTNEANKVIPVWSKGSSLTWTISYGGYKKDATNNKCSLQLGKYLEAKNSSNTAIAESISLTSSTFDGTVFRDITNDLGEYISTYNVALIYKTLPFIGTDSLIFMPRQANMR